MRILLRIVERILLFFVALFVIWVIVTQIFDRLDERMPAYLALVITYVFVAYIAGPRLIHLALMVGKKGHIPRFSRAGDGLIADPVNLIFFGTAKELEAAFEDAGWHQADKLSPKSVWRMGTAFVFNRSYPHAPFSSLYLFGRPQDYGFQIPIGKSPRKRHHVRFWAANHDPRKDLMDIQYWTSEHPIDPQTAHVWVGSGVRDIGFGFSKLTYQLTHAVDAKVDEERDYILDTLRTAGRIHAERVFESGEFVINTYVSDGKIYAAHLSKNE